MRRRPARWLALFTLLVAAPLAAQQPLRGNEAMPAGHPTIAPKPASSAGAPAKSAAPAASAAAPPAHAAGSADEDDLPAGHPSLGAPPSAAREPEFTPPPDRVAPDKELPAGSIRARIVDPKEAPLAGVDVRLGILRQTIAEGESREERRAISDGEGWVRFDGLKQGSEFSYRVTVARGAANYASTPFNLPRETGQSVLLHIYPVVREISQALVGMRGYISVEPKDEVFQFEGMYQIFNIGPVTCVPEGVVIDLPSDHRAAKGDESMSDVRFETVEGRGLSLEGTITPGQHQVSFRFQVPRDGSDSASFRLTLPPHVAEQQVITLSARGMSLAVDGFPNAQPATSKDGQRLLGTALRMHQGEAPLRQLVITLSGIPGPGPARWVAAALAGVVALAGLYFAWQERASGASGRLPGLAKGDSERAKELLLTELVALEMAHSKQQIGPRTYESARRSLLEALVRLEAAFGSLIGPSTAYRD